MGRPGRLGRLGEKDGIHPRHVGDSGFPLSKPDFRLHDFSLADEREFRRVAGIVIIQDHRLDIIYVRRGAIADFYNHITDPQSRFFRR